MTSQQRTTQSKSIQEISDRVTRIEITQQEVLLPLVKETAASTKSIADKDFLTKEEARSQYVTKDEFKLIRNAVWVIISSVLVALITAGIKALSGE